MNNTNHTTSWDNVSTTAINDGEDGRNGMIIFGYPDPPVNNYPQIPPRPDPTNAGPTGGPIVIRTEEVLIVVFVLILWAFAIALFFNRWGKIRMLEPYQPKFHEEEHRPSCPLVELSNPIIAGQHRTSLSKYNITPNSCFEPTYVPPAHRALLKSRTNSVFAGNGSGQRSSSMTPNSKTCPRKTRSAIDINSMVQRECSCCAASGPRGSCASAMNVAADRRQSYAQHPQFSQASGLKDRRSCSLFPGAHDRRLSCIGECSLGPRERFGYNRRDSISPFGGGAFGQQRRQSGTVDSHLTLLSAARDGQPRKASFNNVIAQVAAERRPSSSMLRISHV